MSALQLARRLYFARELRQQVPVVTNIGMLLPVCVAADSIAVTVLGASGRKMNRFAEGALALGLSVACRAICTRGGLVSWRCPGVAAPGVLVCQRRTRTIGWWGCGNSCDCKPNCCVLTRPGDPAGDKVHLN